MKGRGQELRACHTQHHTVRQTDRQTDRDIAASHRRKTTHILYTYMQTCRHKLAELTCLNISSRTDYVFVRNFKIIAKTLYCEVSQ